MAHMGLGPGTAHIFDEVDKSDFKSDFGSEFPVGSTFDSHLLLIHHTPSPAQLVSTLLFLAWCAGMTHLVTEMPSSLSHCAGLWLLCLRPASLRVALPPLKRLLS